MRLLPLQKNMSRTHLQMLRGCFCRSSSAACITMCRLTLDRGRELQLTCSQRDSPAQQNWNPRCFASILDRPHPHTPPVLREYSASSSTCTAICPCSRRNQRHSFDSFPTTI